MDGRQRTVVAGVHGLQHIQGFFAADLTDDDSIGTHTQAVHEQLALPDRAVAFQVGRAGLKARHVGLLELQLGRVLDGDDPFFR